MEDFYVFLVDFDGNFLHAKQKKKMPYGILNMRPMCGYIRGTCQLATLAREEGNLFLYQEWSAPMQRSTSGATGPTAAAAPR